MKTKSFEDLEYGVLAIVGKTGVGKSSFETALALSRMSGRRARDDLRRCRRMVDRLNAGGYNLTVPEKHLVFADYKVVNRAGVSSYYVNGYYLCVPNNRHSGLFLPYGANVFLDEAEKVFNSRMSYAFADYVAGFYNMRRHWGMSICYNTHRVDSIDVILREITDKFVYIERMEVKYDSFNRITHVLWRCREFVSAVELGSWLDSGFKEKAGVPATYCFEGNIFRFYDNECWFPLFLRGNEARDFDVYPGIAAGFDIETVRAFNAEHGFEVPETFYKKGVKV